MPHGCSTFVVIGFKFCRKNVSADLNGPEAPAGTEPAVEKDAVTALWTFLQGETFPL